jgi:hypothetical protein
VFCAGEYAIADTGQCIVSAAGAPAARGVMVPVPSTAARAAAAVSVPVALGAEAQAAYGPPRSADEAATTASDVAQDPAPAARGTPPGVMVRPLSPPPDEHDPEWSPNAMPQTNYGE